MGWIRDQEKTYPGSQGQKRTGSLIKNSAAEYRTK
jgi:hypothetical protein